MEPNNPILHTALLGTDKRPLRPEELPPALGEAAARLGETEGGREEQFLQLAALARNYRRCGLVPARAEGAHLPPAPEEEKSPASPEAHRLLTAILSGDIPSLLGLWLQRCAGSGVLADPGYAPRLLEAATRHKGLRPFVLACTGQRGAWLARFNESWKWQAAAPDEELWQTGTAEQRREVLGRLRRTDPATALAWLQATWPQETAAGRAALLPLLSGTVTEADRDWLERLLSEKSARVKEEALLLLKQLPTSSIIQHYQSILKEAVQQGPAGLHLELPPLDEKLYKTGIEKISSRKGADDNAFVLYQLMEAVPPAFWEAHLGTGPEGVLRLLAATKHGDEWITALGKAAIRFRDTAWLNEILSFRENLLFPEALPLLEPAEREAYALRFLHQNQYAADIIELLVRHHTEEWGPELALGVLRHTARNPYAYPRPFYNGLAARLPVRLISELPACTPKEPHFASQWTHLSDYLAGLLQLKQETLNAFHL
ncbi:DUF5691 domain-containing protein [Paraflavisolibacter sp. H34]|uniref:DUF5691 domain-containing protein n=1 Tax=Huijunlia imazamoxiresistens TaxID=3127457 RepID=UPI0030194EEB